MTKKTDFSPMKKIFAFAGLMTAAVISLTNCQPKELGTEILPGKTFTISATTQADTRTTNDGMSTLWEAADTVNVFFGESAGKGTVKSGAGSNHATFEVEGTEPASAVDWYVFFPYNSHMTDPNGTAGYNYIGHSKGVNQDGFDNMSALRGNVCPMYGVAKGQTADEALITMKHLTSVIEFNVTNNTGSAVVVNSISLNATEDIVGTYYIDFASDPVVYTSSGASYVYNTATVNIEDGSLNNGESGKAYLPVKPYTHNSSKTFDVTVNCTVGGQPYSQEIKLSPSGNQCVFAPGKIKKVNLNLTSLTPKSDSIADAHNASTGTEMVFNDVIVSSVMKRGFFITDNTDILYVYLNNAPSVTQGQKVSVSGKIGVYAGNKQVTNDPAPAITASGTGSVTLRPVTYTGSDVAAAFVDNNAKYVKLVATASSTTIAKVDGSGDIELYIATNNRVDGVTISKDKTYEITGYIYGHRTNSGVKQVLLYAESAIEQGGATANLTVSPTTLNFTADGGSEDVTVTCDNSNWTIDAETVPDWLTAAKGSGKITFTVPANHETKRSATVKINHSNGSLTATVKVNQDGEVETDILSLGVARLSFTAKETEVKFVKVTSNNTNWTVGTPSESWLTVSKVVSEEECGINVSVSENKGEAREATVTLTHSNGELYSTLTVSQSAAGSGTAVTYTKVTSSSQLTAGNYLIVCEDTDYVMNGGLTNLDSAGGLTGLINSGSVTTDQACYFTYNPSEGSFKSASGKYLASKNSDANGLETKDDYDETVCKMTVSFDSGNAHIVAPFGCVLRFNATSGQMRFRFYKSSTYTAQKPIQLYKKQ